MNLKTVLVLSIAAACIASPGWCEDAAQVAQPPVVLGPNDQGGAPALPLPPLPAGALISGAPWLHLIKQSADLSRTLEFKGGGEAGKPVRVVRMVMSQWWTNCYVLVGKHGKCIIIDPTDVMTPLPDGKWALTGVDTDRLIALLKDQKLDPAYIISTHGHLDHVSGAAAIEKKYHPIFAMGAADIDKDGRPKDSHMFDPPLPKVDLPLKDGDVISCDGIKLHVMTTPGHSPGSICLKCGDWLFSGDTLFFHLAGRVNFHDGSGSWPQEYDSITKKLYTLPAATLVMPGHYWFTTIGEEKANNLSTAMGRDAVE